MIEEASSPFALRTACVDVPCWRAIPLIVSPDTTTYVPAVSGAAGAAGAGGAAGDVAPGMAMLCPG